MKPETRKALITLSEDAKREVIVLLAEHMDAAAFAAAFYADDGDPTKEGLAIIDQVTPDDLDPDAVREEVLAEMVNDADAIHAAICEGRKQDAVDLLNKIIPEANLRTVRAQNYLFPDRVQLDL